MFSRYDGLTKFNLYSPCRVYCVVGESRQHAVQERALVVTLVDDVAEVVKRGEHVVAVQAEFEKEKVKERIL